MPIPPPISALRPLLVYIFVGALAACQTSTNINSDSSESDDLTVKDVEISMKPMFKNGDSRITNRAPEFTFTTSATDLTFHCAMDSDPLALCLSPFKSQDLTEGPHQLNIVIRDSQGVQAPGQYRFIVDATNPTGNVVINDGASYTLSPTVSIVVSAEDTASGIRSIRICNKTGTLSGCTDLPMSNAENPHLLWKLDDTFADGMREVSVELQDGVGNSATATDTIILQTVKMMSAYALNSYLTYDYYVTDADAGAVYRLPIGSNAIPIANITVAAPLGIAVTNYAVALYISDPENNAVYEYDAPSQNTTPIPLCDNPNCGCTLAPAGLALNSGNLYIADSGNKRILKLTKTASSWECQPVIARDSFTPVDLLFDSNNNLFVTDVENSRILLFIPNGDTYAPPISWGTKGSGTPGQFRFPTEILYATASVQTSSAHIHVSDIMNRTVTEISSTLGTTPSTSYGLLYSDYACFWPHLSGQRSSTVSSDAVFVKSGGIIKNVLDLQSGEKCD